MYTNIISEDSSRVTSCLNKHHHKYYRLKQVSRWSNNGRQTQCSLNVYEHAHICTKREVHIRMATLQPSRYRKQSSDLKMCPYILAFVTTPTLFSLHLPLCKVLPWRENVAISKEQLRLNISFYCISYSYLDHVFRSRGWSCELNFTVIHHVSWTSL